MSRLFRKESGNFFWIFALAFMAVLFMPIRAEAGLVEPSGEDGYEDYRNIAAELSENNSVTLQSGGTYYLNRTIYLSSNQSIIATGATIYTAVGTVRNYASSSNYDSVSNISITGGTWLRSPGSSYNKTAFQFVHGTGITLKDMVINNTVADAHAIEIIACKNVVVDNCKVTAIGSPSSKKSVEEGIQFDIATVATAPVVFSSQSGLANGNTCMNVKITDCEVSGFGRGVCANFTETENNKWRSKYHKNFTVTGCTITSATSEALALLNVSGATVKGNTLTSNAKKSRSYYASGLHIATYGKNKAGINTAKYVITSNTVKGTNYGMHIDSNGGGHMGTVTIKNNTVSSKQGPGSAIRCLGIKKVVQKNNKIK